MWHPKCFPAHRGILRHSQDILTISHFSFNMKTYRLYSELSTVVCHITADAAPVLMSCFILSSQGVRIPSLEAATYSQLKESNPPFSSESRDLRFRNANSHPTHFTVDGKPPSAAFIYMFLFSAVVCPTRVATSLLSTWRTKLSSSLMGPVTHGVPVLCRMRSELILEIWGFIKHNNI